MIRPPLRSTLFPYTTLFRSAEPITPALLTSTSTAPSSRSTSATMRSEEHTSELQSRVDLVCRLLLEKKNTHASQAMPGPHLLCTAAAVLGSYRTAVS